MMRLLFAASDKPREQQLARAFAAGVKAHGDEAVVCHNGDIPALAGFNALAMVGVKSRDLFARAKAAGCTPLMFDKGYVRTRRAGGRTWEFWRVSAGAHHPTGTTLMARKYPPDRFEALELDYPKWRRNGLQVVFAGSSGKYHDFYGLADPTAYAKGLFEQIRQLTDRPIVYRPKPSWREAVAIEGSRFSLSNEGILGALANAHVLVTHGSNACFEAALAGIPSLVLGDAVARPISSTTLEELESPRLGKRSQWLANLAYHQFTEDEMESGEAWATISHQIRDANGTE